jgi:hypothetical protein
VVLYPQCSIGSEKGYLQSCLPSRDKVSVIDRVLYPIGACKPLLSSFDQSDLEFPLEFNLTLCKTSIPDICVLSSLGFMDVEFPSDEAILEVMIMDVRNLSELEYLHVDYQRSSWYEPSNGIYPEKYYA